MTVSDSLVCFNCWFCNDSWECQQIASLAPIDVNLCLWNACVLKKKRWKHFWSPFFWLLFWYFASHVYCFHNTWFEIVLCLLILFCCFLVWIKLWVGEGYTHTSVFGIIIIIISYCCIDGIGPCADEFVSIAMKVIIIINLTFINLLYFLCRY